MQLMVEQERRNVDSLRQDMANQDAESSSSSSRSTYFPSNISNQLSLNFPKMWTFLWPWSFSSSKRKKQQAELDAAVRRLHKMQEQLAALREVEENNKVSRAEYEPDIPTP